MALDVNERDIEALTKMRVWEERATGEQMRLGWQWFDVGVHMGTINKLLTMGLVERTYSSRSSKHHKLTEKAKLIMDGSDETTQIVREMDEEPTPDAYLGMFDDIVGYDDIKELIREGIQLEKPIHVLLVGPPAIAKSMFLIDTERLLGRQSMWMLGSGTSKAGLWDAIAEEQPRVILIDELDKMTRADSSSLLSLMEKGRITRVKVGRKLDVTLSVWVVACANRLSSMSPELLSRFKIKRVEEYSAKEFREVVSRTLVRHEDMDGGTAAIIATKLLGKTHNVRDAIRVARLSKRVGVDRAVELIVD